MKVRIIPGQKYQIIRKMKERTKSTWNVKQKAVWKQYKLSTKNVLHSHFFSNDIGL